ncbi:MAG TPA: cupredoxin domain-containing protein [Gaiellaceae bacterium]|jgi:plastocyanin
MRRAALFLATCLLLLAGCGGGGSDSGGIDLGDTDTGTSSGADFEVFASEYAFAPPFLALDKPGTYTFSIRNDGNEPHNFTIKGVGGTENAAPGETKTVELTLKPGNYEIVCTVDAHEEQGMFGTLNVAAG